MVSKLREDGGFGWWEEYEVLRRKYELGSEYGSVCNWYGNDFLSPSPKMRNEKDWEEEVSSKSTLKWYKLAKNGTGCRGILGLCRVKKCEAAVQTEDWLSWVVGG